MDEIINIYCDESCHLEHDGHSIMVLGAVWCPLEKTREIADQMRSIRSSHNLDPFLELKWGKVSPAQLSFYSDMLAYFFEEPDLHFRALIVPDKSKLRHDAFDQDHDTFYYKMYFTMLKPLIEAGNRYRIYVDLKDTRGGNKIRLLHKVLCNNVHDLDAQIIERIKQVRSEEVQQVQMADFLIGIISYANRHVDTSDAKLMLIRQMIHSTKHSLTRTTAPDEKKVNIFRWKPQED